MKNNTSNKKRKLRSFSKTLREVRRSMGLTQERMARRISVARASLSRYETGKQMPSIEVLDRLHRETNIPFDALMGYTLNLSASESSDNHGMTMTDYQSLASRTINGNLTKSETMMHALHEIASECGEIHGHFQKLYQGHKLDENALMLEVGDLLWGIAELCTASGWMLEDVAQANIEKLERRYPDGFSDERSRNRQEE